MTMILLLAFLLLVMITCGEHVLANEAIPFTELGSIKYL
jgi:hypothetical protein